MKPQTLLLILIIGAVAAAGGYFAGQHSNHTSAGSAKKTWYHCGMHPEHIQDHPGNCSICGMKLTPIRDQSSVSTTGERKIRFYKSTMNAGEISQSPGKDSMGMDMVPVYEDASGTTTISIDPVTVQNMGVRTAEVRVGPVKRDIRTVGMIEHSEAAMVDVTTKYKGWIEKLIVDTTGGHVHQGDPLFEMYSPELYSAQVEYLQALKANGSTPDSVSPLLESARIKLKFYDVTDAQIEELERSGTPRKTMPVLSPISGYVMEKMAVQGQMAEAGMKLYRLVNHDTIWVQAQIYENDLPFVTLGQEASVTVSQWPDLRFRGRVTFIYPLVDEMTRTVKARLEFHNPGHMLRPGMYATVKLAAEVSPSSPLVPDMAVLRSGEKNTVFVALGNGRFEPREVIIGARSENNEYQVLSGLKGGESVVTSGQFMLDSESQLREAIQKMVEPAPLIASTNITLADAGTNEADTHEQHLSSFEVGTVVVDADSPSDSIYICPMPEHVAIEYSHPGKCSLCGMTLVPVSAELLARIQPGGKLLYYGCPMPEHGDVHEKEPGRCPLCGMTLVPVMSLPALSQDHDNGATFAELLDRLYTCPMAIHADVVSDKPGKCPKCGMDLVKAGSTQHGETAVQNWLKARPETEAHQH